MSDRTGARVITARYRDGRGERTVIEPRSDGHYDVETRILTKGGDWRPAGHEVATEVAVERLDARADGSGDALRRHLTAALETVATDDTDTRFHLRQALQFVDALEADR